MVDKETSKHKEKVSEQPAQVQSEWQKKNAAYKKKQAALARREAEQRAAEAPKKAQTSASAVKSTKLKKKSGPKSRENKGRKTPPSEPLVIPHLPFMQFLQKIDIKRFVQFIHQRRRKQVRPRYTYKLPWRSILMSTPIMIASAVLLILSLYFISPYSKLKDVSVVGQSYLTEDRILELTEIYKGDYTLTTLLNKERHADKVKHTSNMVKKAAIKYQFPISFTIHVEEYQIVAYIRESNVYYPVLSNGNMAPTDPVTDAALAEQQLLLNFNDSAMVKRFVLELSNLEPDIVANMASVVLSPNETTEDLLTLTMHDGNIVYVPLSQFSLKMAYYPNIVSQLGVASYIDMEVGVYAYAIPAPTQ